VGVVEGQDKEEGGVEDECGEGEESPGQRRHEVEECRALPQRTTGLGITVSLSNTTDYIRLREVRKF
jgi:hypothetical protein